MQVLKRYLRKRRKILRGLRRTYLQRDRTPYQAGKWFDEFFADGLSDRRTISPDHTSLAAAYHYRSVEILILRHFLNNACNPTGWSVCDLGPGSGHWIDFYRSLGASRVMGIDVSQKSVQFLAEKYQGQNVDIRLGKIHEVLASTDDRFDCVNGIGVMFHVVADDEWEETVRQVGNAIAPGGLFVVGGHFGVMDGVNVQFDSHRAVNKRLRSARHWKRSLQRTGFTDTTILRNPAYLFIDESLPENNVLISRKGA